MLRLVRDAVVDLVAHAAHVLIGAACKRDAHGDRSEVKVLLRDHGKRLGYFLRRDIHLGPFAVAAGFVTPL